MKRILIALAVLLAVQVADAQVKSAEAAKKAVEAAEKVAQDPKKNTKVATWLKLATTYMDAYEAPAGNVLLNSVRLYLCISHLCCQENCQCDQNFLHNVLKLSYLFIRLFC